MGILHEVSSGAVGGVLRDDLPVAVLLDHRADVADGGTQVGDTEARTSLCGGESLAASEVVDDAALLGESVVTHNIESPKLGA